MAGKRYSRQRELIHQCLMATKEHPTAEMVYNTLRPTNPNLSLGTVYRNLNLLADEGVITRLSFPIDRYDATTAPHAHFCCEVCGQVSDIPSFPYHDSLHQEVGRCCGHQVARYDVTFTGTCCHCIEKH